MPCGSPGIGLLIEGAMQQAAQPGRQFRAGGRWLWMLAVMGSGLARLDGACPRDRCRHCFT